MLCLNWQSPTQATTLYKWVDSEGRITYQDQPPAEGQAFEKKVIDNVAPSAESDAQRSISRAASNSPITLFSVPKCDSCELAQNFLERNQVPFKILNVEGDASIQSVLKGLTGSLRVPVVTVGKTIVNGFNRDELEEALKQHEYPILPPTGI